LQILINKNQPGLLEAMLRKGLRPQNSHLLSALQQNPRNMTMVNALLKHKAPVDAAILTIAVNENDLELVRKMLVSKIVPSAAMLNIAMDHNNAALLELLLSRKVPEQSNLAKAATLNSTAFFTSLVNAGGFLTDNAPLATAITNENLDILNIGLANGGDTNNALDLAIAAGWQEGIRKCLKAHAQANRALPFAIQNQDLTLFKDLLTGFGGDPFLALEQSMASAWDEGILFCLELGTLSNAVISFAVSGRNEAMLTAILTKVKIAREKQARGKHAGNPEKIQAALATIQIQQRDLVHELLSMSIRASWTEGILICLANGANADLAIPFAVKMPDPDLLNTILSQHGGDADLALRHIMASGELIALVRIALDNGADPAAYISGQAEQGDEPMVRLFLDFNADANLAMSGTVRRQNLELLQFLITEKGADATPAEYLKMAATQGNLEMVKLLVGNGANPNHGFQEALANGNAEIIQFLLENGANGAIPLDPLARKGQLELVRLLVLNGADPQTGMLGAVEADQLFMVRLLSKLGATAAGFLHIPAEKGNMDMIKLLLQPELGATPDEGVAAAVSNNRLEVLQFLLDQDADGSDAEFLRLAVENGFDDLIPILLKAGADPNLILFEGKAPLHLYASRAGYLEIVNAFIAADADLDLRDDGGHTPMHYAVQVGDENLSVVRALVDAGASVNQKNRAGKRILFFAHGKEVIAFLREKRAMGKVNPMNFRKK
jgi:ankyrin repeat protein